MTLTIRGAETPNFHKGRRGNLGLVDQVVIHVTEGDAGSVLEWFKDPVSQVSAHYMVTKTGVVYQFVDEADEAFAQGRVDHPTAPLVLARPEVNPNYYSIGIEHEGSGKEELTDAQRKASIELIRDICTRHNIPRDRRHIVGHHEIYSLKTCPGAISVDKLTAQVASDGHPGSPDIPVPQVVWSNLLQDYLIVTKRVSDDEWYFVQLKSLGAGQKAGAPLSAFPLAKPAQ